MILKKKVIELAEQRIQELNNGSYLVDVTISTKNMIHVEIDNSEKGVSIEDCISVSRNVEHNLDREAEDFDLNVSSPGLDQPFKVINQFYKNIGKKVKVVFQTHGSQEGVLKEVDAEKILIQWEEKTKIEGKKKKISVIRSKSIPFNKIKETRLIISFK